MRFEFNVNYRDCVAFEKTGDYVTCDTCIFTVFSDSYQKAVQIVKEISDLYLKDNIDYLDDYFISLSNVMIDYYDKTEDDDE